MPLIHAVRRNAGSLTSADGTAPEGLDASRYGELFQGPNYIERRSLAGKAFVVTVGAVSTPIQGGGAGTVIDPEQPELRICIPANTICIPTRIVVTLKTPLAATDSDIIESFIGIAQGVDATGSGTAETIQNKRGDLLATGSNATVTSAMTGDAITPTIHTEIEHLLLTADMNGTPANAMWNAPKMVYELKSGMAPYLIAGASGATLYVYWGGTVATSGYCTVEWVEFPSGYAN
jgi:hypothetical protein